MRSRICLVFSLSCVLLAGCYDSSGSGHDATDGPVADPRPDGTGDTMPDTSPPPDVVPDFPPDFPPDAMACNEDSHCATGEFCEFYAGQCRGPGICVKREDAPCPPVYDPVCGCNGVTYPDICTRRLAGVSEMHPGECPEEPCLPGDPEEACSGTFFCEGPFGACYDTGVTGWCEPIPLYDCPDLWDPVCGCDGQTYPNDCRRMQAEVWALHRGDCTEEPCLRGDPTGVCPEYQFCEGPEGLCDVTGGAGWCKEPDDSCGWLWDPVCGCDGETYPNDCERQKAGVWLDRRGECDEPPPPIRTCGPRFPDCPYDEFCEFPAGDCGRREDSVGGCVERPEGCPEIYDPVCGCNRETYGNDCERQAAGEPLCHRGECTAGSCPPG